MTISGNKLEDIIKPEMMLKYKKGLEDFVSKTGWRTQIPITILYFLILRRREGSIIFLL
jgi:hypothetical protein